MTRLSDKEVSRRTVLQAAVAVGGSVGLSACLSLDGGNGVDIPVGTDTPGELPERQHAWDEFLETDVHGNVEPPRHHILVFGNYSSNKGTPEAEDRDLMKEVFHGLEEACEWSNNGLLFTVGYSPSYFNRYDSLLPDSVDLPEPAALASFEDPEFDTADFVIHLASDHAKVVIQVEQALKGDVELLNGIDVPDDGLTSVVEFTGRRTGFVGKGLPAEHDEVDGVPTGAVDEDAPLFMGFKSTFSDTQPSEDRVTIPDGPFAGGTTQHVSKLHTHLDQWYEQDSRWQRVAKMFSPTHAEDELVDGVGENLEDSSRAEEEGIADTLRDDAFTKGVIGHQQKTAQAREEGEPIILRRDFASTDGGRTGLHFVSLHETIGDFVRTREAMNGEDFAGTGGIDVKNNNGILQYITTMQRGNYLLPPRSVREFPPASPSSD